MVIVSAFGLTKKYSLNRGISNPFFAIGVLLRHQRLPSFTTRIVRMQNPFSKSNTEMLNCLLHSYYRIMDQLLECTAILTECMVSHFEQSEQKMFSLPIDPSASNNVQECEELLLKEQEDRHSISKRSPGKSSSGGSSGSKVSQVGWFTSSTFLGKFCF